MPLRHIHLHHTRLPGPPDRPLYDVAVKVQSHFQDLIRDYKASLTATTSKPPPPPTLITFTPQPTYTLGRRQTSPLTPADEKRLRAPLRVWYNDRDGRGVDVSRSEVLTPRVTYAPRGGLTTYHGPGQLVFWPVIDLHSPLHRHFTVREYACLLEQTTIAALARLAPKRSGGLADGSDFRKCRGRIQGFTTENPGVWVRHDGVGIWPNEIGAAGQAPKDGGEDTAMAAVATEERKIAAMGVHLRRHVTGLGVAINVSTAVSGPEDTNPWARIVACGLEDKRVTSIGAELLGDAERTKGSPILEELEYALRRVWAREFAGRLFGTTVPDSAIGDDSPYHDWGQKQNDCGLWLPNSKLEESSSAPSGVVEAIGEEAMSVVRTIEDRIVVDGKSPDIRRAEATKKRAKEARDIQDKLRNKEGEKSKVRYYQM